MKLRLLVVEDDVALGQSLLEALGQHSFAPVLARSRLEAEALIWQKPYDLFLLDVRLPEGEEAGFELARDLRAAGFLQPILFLTAREALPDRVRGLSLGEDYLAKPFALPELVARLRALARRGEIRPQVLTHGRLSLVQERREVRYEGELVRLSAKEYQVLELFLLSPGRVFTREEILERVWGPGFECSSNLVEVYVKNLRRRIRENLIETVRGLGYRLGEPL
ncbi:MAG: response regulator transcription factor [Meiothermus sp.]|uniref:response regulator transcription factor n=2 Tax=Meiothermus sp. TaxID=1955249 RepID=UPI002623B3CA|nr:response regulator transcription factor [Meiothermus sp.]MCS7058557.1 response regulator transcription factor [Meiothermus sp.]MCX7739534.1 response regulator transcription factor [Meiothermus sp.]MDW8481551.1 response regulator transcription factor [Meiothermus sp.]